MHIGFRQPYHVGFFFSLLVSFLYKIIACEKKKGKKASRKLYLPTIGFVWGDKNVADAVQERERENERRKHTLIKLPFKIYRLAMSYGWFMR